MRDVCRQKWHIRLCGGTIEHMEKILDAESLTSENYGIENISRVSTDTFTQTSLSLIFPRRIIKRVIYRPYLGKWYPHLDIFERYKDPQSTFFYGSVNIILTHEKICALCEEKLETRDYLDSATTNPNHEGNATKLTYQGDTRLPVPVCLCSKCRKLVYYDYWECLSNIIEFSFKSNAKSENEEGNDHQQIFGNHLIDTRLTSKKETVCENLLEPKCGYPEDFERLNPCLENFGIGLVMVDVQTLKIFIAPKKSLKYEIMWHGGLFGLILGRHNRIINMETLREFLPKVVDNLKNILKEIYNTKSKIKSGTKEGNHTIPITIQVNNLPAFGKKEELISQSCNIIAEWLMFAFFDYYHTKEAKTVINLLLQKPASILEHIIMELRNTMDIETLEFINIYKKFPPLSTELREYIESSLNHYLLTNNIITTKKSSKTLLKSFLDIMNKKGEKDRKSEINTIRRLFNHLVSHFQYFHSYQLNNLDLYEIHASIGSLIIAQTNLSREPSIIPIRELIGRVIY
ncbi:MAG: hypothetical protein GF311_11450 [Candidatus Lokiarchaeota archaeon]|nr:hypothetical protein [Candidatus Lokiarchaeota archaeon]